jgi:hypothetical protein
MAQWPSALPRVALSIAPDPSDPSRVLFQGTPVAISEFEPTLTFAQQIPSPWSKGDWVVVAGSWNSYATPTLWRLLTDPAVVNRLAGSMAALDVKGRVVSYDMHKTQQESFGDRLLRMIPMGQSAQDSHVTQSDRQTRDSWIKVATGILACAFLAVLAGGVWFQITLMRERERKRRIASKTEE